VKQLHRKIQVVLILAILFQSKIIQASHSKGVDLTYKCLGNNEYDFLLTFYQDCAGSTDVRFDAQPKLLISSTKCGYFQEVIMQYTEEPEKYDTLFNANNEVVSIKPNFEATTLCNTAKSTCNGGPYDGVEKFTFRRSITLPSQCDDWVISYANCCRNEDITNLVFPDNAEIYVEARINNTNGICNNSPTFSGLAGPYLCVGQKSFYNHGVTDVDGNNLRFTLINPMQEGGVPIKMRKQIGFSAQAPIRTINDDFYMDPQTGQMQFTPAYIEKDALTVLVEEFDENNVLLGAVMRDIQMILYDCTNKQSILENNGISAQSLQSALFVNESTIESCPGNNIQFQLEVTDADALDTLSFQTNLKEIIPNATFIKTGTNPLTLTFNWTPNEADVGTYNFVLTLLDNFCPVPSTQTFGFIIKIVEGVSLGEDIIKCSNDEIKLTATGGTDFNWSITPDNGSNTRFIDGSMSTAFTNPTQTTTYVVTSNLPGNCKSTGTLKIEVENEVNYNIKRNIRACESEVVTLEIEPGNVSANYSYAWQPADLLNSPNSANPKVIALQDQVFYVDITTPSGCIITDSVDFKVKGILPNFNLSVSENEVCEGDPITLTVENNCDFCQPDLGTINSFAVTPFNLIWEDAKLQLLIRTDELIASGLKKGLIEQIGLSISRKFSDEAYENFQIAMGLTNFEELNVNLGYIKSLKTVMQPIDYETIEGENIFIFTSNFYWDGESNIIIEFCYDNNGIDSIADEIVSTTTDYVSCLTSYSSQAEQCNMTANEQHYQRPNIRFITNKLDTKNFTVEWPAELENSISTNSAVITVVGEKFYPVKVSVETCTATDSIFINTLESPTVDLGEDVSFASGQTVQLNATGDFESFEWINPIGLSDISITDPIYDLHESTIQIIEVLGENGCTNTDSIKLKFLGCVVNMPNAFSPNEDGINDTFGPLYFDNTLVINNFDIYNRYGERIFETSGNKINWDGTFKNQNLPIGVYSYFLSFTCDNKTQQQKGNLTLVR